MLTLLDRRVGDHRFVVVASERTDGDMHPHNVSFAALSERQRDATGQHWSMVDQCHGIAVHHVTSVGSPTETSAATVVADLQRTEQSGRHLAMWAADCAVVFLAGSTGNVVAVHAGWRGLAAGALDVACDELGETALAAVLGPTIHPCCYEFGVDDLALVAAGVEVEPAAISGVTSDGRRALDVPAAVTSALERRGVALDAVGPCTGCDGRWFSHRVGRDSGRHATIGWMDVESERKQPGESDGT